MSDNCYFKEYLEEFKCGNKNSFQKYLQEEETGAYSRCFQV